MAISSYSTTAASNNSAVPNGWPEGMAPSGVNDCGRQMMADVRSWYEDAEWLTWGDTTAYVSGTSFKIAGSDVTARYSVGRRVRAVGSGTGTIYGKILTSAFSTDTTLTAAWDSGSLSNETLTISIAANKGNTTGRSVDLDAVTRHGSDVASAATVILDNTTGDLVDVTGTITWTAVTLAEGRERTVRHTGIQTLTNGASLVLPGAANITTAAGDFSVWRGYAAGVVRCVNYVRASGQPLVSGSSFADNVFFITDDGDATKKIAFQASGITAGNTRTFTAPDASGTLALTSGVVFSLSFTSTDQTITSAGALTLAHGLGAVPKQIQLYLVAQNTVLGYTAGDIVLLNNSMANGANQGTSIVPDATNINVRYGSDTNAFQLIRKDNGVGAGCTNSDWKLRVRAWA